MSNSNIRALAQELGALGRTCLRAVRKIATDVHDPISRESQPLRHAAVRFEHTDVNAPKLVTLGIGLIIIVWILVALIYFYFSLLARYRASVGPQPLPITLTRNPRPPQPHLQAFPRRDLKTYLSQQNWMLDHYTWIDKKRGTVAIPIDHAMDILAARGIPPQKAPPNLVLSRPRAGARLPGFEEYVEPQP
jgi:hypothetical protein